MTIEIRRLIGKKIDLIALSEIRSLAKSVKHGKSVTSNTVACTIKTQWKFWPKMLTYNDNLFVMPHLKKNALIFAALFATIFLFSGCDDENESISGDYYPLNDRTERYQEYIYSWTDDAIIDHPWGTTTVEIASSTKVDGKDYKVVSHSLGFQRLLRKESCRYFARDQVYAGGPYDDNEYMFLDVSLPVGSTWTIDQPNMGRSVVFTIKEKNTSIEEFDRTFNDVIVVQEETYRGVEEVPLTSYRYYQKDVGEVYNYLPYPLSLRYGDIASILLR